MEFLTLKTLTVGMLISTAISTSVVPIQSTTPVAVNTSEIVSKVELGSESNIDVPARAVALAAAKAAVAGKSVAKKPQAQTTTKVAAQVPSQAAIVYASASPKTRLDAWIDGLIQKESSGKTNIKILDVNDRYSYGCLQFQMPTFIAYGKRYGLISGTEANLESIIMDCSLQRTLTKKMILENPANWRHWYHSVYTRGLGLPPLN